MDIDMDSHPVRRLEVVETGRRRRWSAELKRRIVEESLQEGVTASSVARRQGISPAHLFLWRKAHREGELTGSWPGFAPVSFEAAGLEAGAPGGRMEVVASNGRRVIVGADVDLAALVRLLEALERA
jgi:transposase